MITGGFLLSLTVFACARLLLTVTVRMTVTAEVVNEDKLSTQSGVIDPVLGPRQDALASWAV